jgi:hypothetical protein
MSSQLTRPMMRSAQVDDFVVALVDGLTQMPLVVPQSSSDDDVLRHVHQLAGHVAGVGGLERGIGQTLAGAVGGDEVFQHGQALAEVRQNRRSMMSPLGLAMRPRMPASCGPAGDCRARRNPPSGRRGCIPCALVVFEGAEHDVGDLVAVQWVQMSMTLL